MIKYKIKIYSKNKQSISYFFKFFLQTIKKFKNIQRVLSFQRKKKQTKRITLLKSPHVNKTAQEHFQFKIYLNQITIISWDKKKSTTFLKKVKNNLFSDLKIKIEKKTANNKLSSPLTVAKNKILFTSITQLRKRKLSSIKLAPQNSELVKRALISIKNLDSYGHVNKT